MSELPATVAMQKSLEALALKLATEPRVLAAKAAARRAFLDHPNAKTRDGAASLEDAAEQHFFGALQLAVNLDPHRPKLQSLFLYEHATDGQVFPSSLHGGIENPDNVYRAIPVSHERRYVLHGRRHSPPPAQVTFELMDSIPGLDSIGHQIAMLKDRDMVVAADGSYQITLDADAADGRANHIQLTSAARCLFVRDSMADWRLQQPDSLHIEVLPGEAPPPASYEQLVETAAWLAPHYAKFWQDLRDHYVVHMDVKTNQLDAPFMRPGGWQFISNAHYDLGEDEAFVFTTRPMGAPYHAALVANHWWITADAAHHTGSFNAAQAEANADGSITFVVAARDPGVHNWLDTGGVHTGILQARWQGLPSEVTTLEAGIVDFQVARLSDLKSLLPPETRWLTPAERDAQRAARLAAYQLRLSQG
ncbi:MAG: hypothetical protein AB1429_02010 [Pseudomonadota bacterium]|jgi:hypothetical protein